MDNEAGSNLTTGDNNIDIGNEGIAAESKTIRIGDQANQTATFVAGINVYKNSGNPVFIDANGQPGTGTTLQRPPGPAGAGLEESPYVFMDADEPTPAGFSKIGTTVLSYKDNFGQNKTRTLAVYIKD